MFSLAGIAAGVFSGCKKHPEAQAVAPPPNVSTASTPAAPSTPSPTTVQSPTPANPPAATDPNAPPDVGRLSRQLRSWIVGHRRVPQNFEEFAASLNPPPPAPPPGKKYVIQKSTVLLVDR
jgi:hypothetical protein